MRVGIDYRAAASHWPGAGRYARELVRALVRLEDCPELCLFDVGRAARVVDAAALGLPGPGASAASGARVTRRIRRWPRRLLPLLSGLGCDAARLLGGVDLFHEVHADAPPVRGVPRTRAVAELPAPGTDLARRFERGARGLDAALVFAPSLRAPVAARLGLDPARVHAVPVGCEHWRRALPALPPPADPPYVLALGATQPGRRPLAVLAAWELLRARGAPLGLCFAGRAGAAEAELRAACARSRRGAEVERVLDPREQDLPALVAAAAVLVHLDAGACTPVTPLEALALDVPVVASRTPVFADALGAAAELVEPEATPDEIAAALERALARRADPAARAARARVAAEHTWERCARAHVDVWRALLAQPRLRPVQ